MALKKEKTGTVTGAALKQSTRGKKGALTGSDRVTGKTALELPTESSPEVAETDAKARENLAEKLQQGVQTASHIVNNVAATTQAVGHLASKVASTIQGTDDRNPANITDGTLDSTAIMARASAEIDEVVPRMDSGEAIKRNIVIAQQRNYVGVAINNTKLRQDIATLDIEQKRLLGMLIDGKTAQVDNEKKAVTFHRAVVGRDTEISHLEQDRELLTHQRIRTEGTQQQTQHIQEQESLKVEKLREDVERQKLEIQNVQYEKERLKQEVVAKFAAGF